MQSLLLGLNRPYDLHLPLCIYILPLRLIKRLVRGTSAVLYLHPSALVNYKRLVRVPCTSSAVFQKLTRGSFSPTYPPAPASAAPSITAHPGQRRRRRGSGRCSSTITLCPSFQRFPQSRTPPLLFVPASDAASQSRPRTCRLDDRPHLRHPSGVLPIRPKKQPATPLHVLSDWKVLAAAASRRKNSLCLVILVARIQSQVERGVNPGQRQIVVPEESTQYTAREAVRRSGTTIAMRWKNKFTIDRNRWIPALTVYLFPTAPEMVWVTSVKRHHLTGPQQIRGSDI
jgi:hypothetical protein